jgi:hypothetical protein
VKLRKLVMGVAAVGLPLGVLSTVVGTGAAFAGGSIQPGTLTCTAIKGTVSFKPTLTMTPQTVKTTIKITVSGCTPSGGGATPTKGTASSSSTTAGQTCTSLATGSTTPQTLTTKWSPTSIAPSTVTFSGYNPATNGMGDEGFSLPNTGGSASGSGSYMDGDSGASSTAVAYTNLTEAKLAADCAGKGFKKLSIKSGSAFLG